MRDYAVVTPAFWIGETGKLLRGHPEAQLLALYLMTCPHSTMTGVFHCPLIYMAHETGLPIEGATKGLARLSEVGFCEYDEASECVFVVRMASFQIAESLKPEDNRHKGLVKELSKMAPDVLKARFLATYSVAFSLPKMAEIPSPSEAPPKPRTGTRTGTGIKEEGKPSLSPVKPATPPNCPHVEILDLYAKHLPNLPQPKPELWEGTGATNLRERWRWLLTAKKKSGERYATDTDEGLAWFDRFFAYVAESDFLTGRAGKWSCDLHWLVKAANFTKVVQGNYENDKAAA